MAYKLNIFDTLAAIDKRDHNFYDRLSDEQKKGFAPPVVLRWASAVNNGDLSEYHIWLLNERANKHYHELSRFPDIQYRLLSSCGCGQTQRHQWINMAKDSSRKTDKVTDFLLGIWPGSNDQELEIIKSQFTREEFHDFVRHAGLDPDSEQEVIDSYDRLNGFKITKTKTKKKTPSKKGKKPRA